MNGPPEPQPPVETPPPKDRWAARFREKVSAAIAGGIVLITLVLILVAAFESTTPGQFARIKDLLLFVNPVVGIVIGYYFNRVATETRTENAEANASKATEAATEAGRARDAAEAKADEANGSLSDLLDAAENVTPAGADRTLGESGVPGVEPEMARLGVAMARARRTLGRAENGP